MTVMTQNDLEAEIERLRLQVLSYQAVESALDEAIDRYEQSNQSISDDASRMGQND